MAGCLCLRWAASPREIKNGKTSVKTKGAGIESFALSSLHLFLRSVIDSAKRCKVMFEIRRAGSRVSTKLIRMMVPFWELNNQRNVILNTVFCWSGFCSVYDRLDVVKRGRK